MSVLEAILFEFDVGEVKTFSLLEKYLGKIIYDSKKVVHPDLVSQSCSRIGSFVAM